MNEQEARLILQACPPGAADQSDPQVVEALQMAERSPELARWLAEEQAFDRAMSAHLAALPAPYGLKTRILAQNAPPATSRVARWIFSLAGAAALLFLLLQVVDFGRGAAPATASLSGYAGEMVSFVKLPPPLEMESNNLGSIKDWLAKNNRLTPEVPTSLAALSPAGCRILSYREHKAALLEVALECLADLRSRFDVVISDLRMPGFSGVELHDRAPRLGLTSRSCDDLPRSQRHHPALRGATTASATTAAAARSASTRRTSNTWVASRASASRSSTRVSSSSVSRIAASRGSISSEKIEVRLDCICGIVLLLRT